MFTIRNLSICAGLLLATNAAHAAEVNVAIPLDYGLLRNVLVSQLFTGESQTARVWKDGKACSFVDLSDPHIAGKTGQVEIQNHVHAQFGAKMAGKCMTLVKWNGILQTLQQPTVSANGSVLSFPVTELRAFDSQGQSLNIEQLQTLLQQVVANKLADLKLDLNESRDDIIKTLLPYIPADDSEKLHDAVESLRFNRVKAGANSIAVDLGFAAKIKPASKTEVAALSNEEMQQWRSFWQDWQTSLNQRIDQLPLDAELASHRDMLHELLDKAGHAFEAGLSNQSVSDKDPVRQFIHESWDDLAPLLRSVSKQLPGAEGLRYLTLIAATDLMYEVENIGSPFGLEISSNGLRKIARSYLQHKNLNS